VKGADSSQLAIQVRNIQPITIKEVAGSSLYKSVRKTNKKESSRQLRGNFEAIERETLRV
jgi:hypothetical protein